MKKQIKKIISVALSLCLILSVALSVNALGFVKDFNEDGSIPSTIAPGGKKMLKIVATDFDNDTWMQQVGTDPKYNQRVGWYLDVTENETYTISFKYKSDCGKNLLVQNNYVYFGIMYNGLYTRGNTAGQTGSDNTQLQSVTQVLNEDGIYEIIVTKKAFESAKYLFSFDFGQPDTLYVSDFSITDSSGNELLGNADFYNNLDGLTCRNNNQYSDNSNTASGGLTEKDYKISNISDYITAYVLNYEKTTMVSKKMLHFKDEATTSDYLYNKTAFDLEKGSTYAVYFKYKSERGALNPGLLNLSQSNSWQFYIAYTNSGYYPRWLTGVCALNNTAKSDNDPNRCFDTVTVNEDGYSSVYATFIADGYNNDNGKYYCSFSHCGYSGFATDAYIADFKLVKLDSNGNEEKVLISGIDGFTNTNKDYGSITHEFVTYDADKFSTLPTKMIEIDNTKVKEGASTSIGYKLSLKKDVTYKFSFLYRSENDTCLADSDFNDDFALQYYNSGYIKFATHQLSADYRPTASDLTQTGWRRAEFTYTSKDDLENKYILFTPFKSFGKYYIADFRVTNSSNNGYNGYLTENNGLYGMVHYDRESDTKVATTVCSNKANTTGTIFDDVNTNYSDNKVTVTLMDFDADLFRTRLDSVYVSDSGSNVNDGTETSPFASVDKAVNSVAENGKIIIKDTLTYGGNNYEGSPILSGGAVKASARHLNLRGNLALENTTLKLMGNIYTNGNNLTIGENVTGAPVIYTKGGETVKFAASKYDNSISCGADTVIGANGWFTVQKSDKTYYAGKDTATVAAAGTYKFINSPDVTNDGNLDDDDLSEIRDALLNDKTDDKYDLNDDSNKDICDLVRLYNIKIAQ